MTDIVCRDCGCVGDENPDDFAPALCPECYERRLMRISDLFEKKCEALEGRDITPLVEWLAGALETIGGEKRKYARMHAWQLGHIVMLNLNQQLN